MAASNSINGRMQSYLAATAYPGTTVTNFTDNLTRWLKDGTQPNATTQNPTQRFLKLITNAASQ